MRKAQVLIIFQMFGRNYFKRLVLQQIITINARLCVFDKDKLNLCVFSSISAVWTYIRGCKFIKYINKSGTKCLIKLCLLLNWWRKHFTKMHWNVRFHCTCLTGQQGLCFNAESSAGRCWLILLAQQFSLCIPPPLSFKSQLTFHHPFADWM